MMRLLLWGIAGIIILGLFAAYSGSVRVPRLGQDSSAQASLANPASTHCTAVGGTLEIVTESDGQVGYCHLKGGSVCEEWELFRTGTCAALVR